MSGLGAVANIAAQKNTSRGNPMTMIFIVTPTTVSCAKTYAETTPIAVA